MADFQSFDENLGAMSWGIAHVNHSISSNYAVVSISSLAFTYVHPAQRHDCEQAIVSM